MRDFPPFGQELVEAQKRLDDVLARCAIRLKAFGGASGANDNFLFPGINAPADDSDVDRTVPSQDNAG